MKRNLFVLILIFFYLGTANSQGMQEINNKNPADTTDSSSSLAKNGNKSVAKPKNQDSWDKKTLLKNEIGISGPLFINGLQYNRYIFWNFYLGLNVLFFFV